MARRHTNSAVAKSAAEPGVRVAIYIRRSTDEMHQPYSLEAQETKLRAYISSQPGWHLVAVYSDDASGAKVERPDLQRALSSARAGLFDVLLVYRLDRFTRRIRDLADLLDELDRAGVAFRSATEPFDTSTPAGRMLVQMLGVFAEFEREMIIDRVVNGMERATAKGRWTFGTCPFGYQIDPDTRTLVPHPDEMAVVVEIFRLYTRARLGTRAIAARLNEHGQRSRRGKAWSHKTIGDVLTNRAYLGEVQFRDVVTENAHPPLIEPAVFDLADRILLQRAEDPARRAAMASNYHLSGKITCPDCGRKYLGTTATGKRRTYRYYTCFTRNRYGTDRCAAPRIDADALDQEILRALRDFYTDRGHLIAQAIATAKTDHRRGRAAMETELVTLNAQLAKVESAIDRYLSDYEENALDRDVLARRVDTLAIQARQLRHRRDELLLDLDTEPDQPDPAELAAVRDHIIEIIATGSPEERKALCEAAIAELHITGRTTATPVFRVPLTIGTNNSALTGPQPASADKKGVRVPQPRVHRQGLEPRTR